MRFTGFAVLSFLLLAGGCAAGCAGGDSATDLEQGDGRPSKGGAAGSAGAAGKSGGAGKASAGAAGSAGTTGSGGASVGGGSGGSAGAAGSAAGSAGATGNGGKAGASGSAGGGMGALCVRTEDCTGPDMCTGNNGVACIGGFCKPTGQPQTCDDQVACTKDTCDPAKNKCVHTPDDTVCTGGSFCDPGKNCVEQLPCTVADATCDRLNKNICDGLWSCSATSLTCVKAPPACEPRTNAKTTCAPAMGGNPPTCSYTCNDGFNDLNQDIGVPQGQTNDGCECGGATATVDIPTLENKDKNCDGIVGTIEKAIFVDVVSGKDTNPGTMAAPKKTIGAGISAAASAGKDIYVSKGTYPETVTLVAGVNMYGGYDAAKKWTRAEENETIIQSPNEIGVRAVAIDQETEIQSFSIIAKDAVGTAPNGDGVSSYGILVVEAVAKVTVRGCVVSAGDGTDGDDGRIGAKGEDGKPGKPAVNSTHGVGGESSCGATGGDGGDGPGNVAQGGAGISGVTVTGGGQAAAGYPGGAAGKCDTFGSGDAKDAEPNQSIAQPGPAGGNYTSATSGVGSVDANGRYLPLAGGAGLSDGKPGGGGGGGAAGGGTANGSNLICSDCKGVPAGGGGGGGGGACGGKPGTGGRGGGGSFAIMAVASVVTIEGSTLTSSLAGRGGRGGDGGPGGVGGGGGDGAPGRNGPDCKKRYAGAGAKGTKGGDGGPGGAAAGGSGGPSSCIAYQGSEPLAVGTNVCSLGKGGKGGLGGSNGTATPASQGALGVAVEKLEIPL